MLLSRFWYVVLSVALVGVIFLLFLATAVTNRNGQKNAALLLTSASNAVGWYLKDDARTRAAALIPLVLDPAITKGLESASKAEKLSSLKTAMRQKAKKALAHFREAQSDKGRVPFDALWAVDIHGRVLANENFERGTGSEHFELGGYALVADAIHGWIRDDAWVFGGQIYRVVARPVEISVGGTPVGAVVGAKMVDDRFAQDISNRTGAAVAFYAEATRIASGAPPSFDKAALEVTSADIAKLAGNKDYQEKGRTAALLLRNTPGYDVMAIFARMPGDAWDLGAGYVVGHRQAVVNDPLEFQRLAADNDKEAVPLWLIALAAAGAALLGLIFTVFEHTMPLFRFRRAVADLANKKSDTDVLKPSTFRGVYKKIAAFINDSLDKVAADAGLDRGPADLENVLGPLPDQPQMSAFSVPQAGELGATDRSADSSPKRDLPRAKSVPKRSLPKAPSRDEPAPSSGAAPPSDGLPDAAAFSDALSGKGDAEAGGSRSASAPADSSEVPEPADEEAQWRQIYQQFISMKKKLGEPTKKLTYDKFRGTLERNKDALMARHHCTRVKFRVYEKQGRAALKASPVK